MTGRVRTEEAEATVSHILDSLRHRGPDDAGIERLAGSQGALGAVRLAVQDPTRRGHQPMMSPLTQNLIVFNGEIYNVGWLRHELEARGRRFVGSCDTEVVLAAYDEWGLDALTYLRGMFAFAIWDAQRSRMILARDPLGIKPLYVSHSRGVLGFSSELRALLLAGLAEGRLSERGLASFLSFGAAQEPFTMIEGVMLLPAGHYAVYEDGCLVEHEYWSLQRAFEDGHPPLGRSAESEVRTRLEDAVMSHLVSDVPLGIFLSGGIDSTALVALASRAEGPPPRTVSVVSDAEGLNERPWIQAVSKRFGTDHFEVTLTPSEMARDLPAAVAAQDQPSVDGVNTFIVSRLARDAGLTVALAGIGADELFAGYPSFTRIPWLRRGRRLVPGVLGPVVGRAVVGLGSGDRARKLGSWLSGSDGISSAYTLQRALHDPVACAELAPDVIRYLPALHHHAWLDDDINAVSMMELSTYMRNTLLRDADVMSMAHGLEIRVPFLDERLVSFVAGLPGKLKRPRGGGPKPLLVEAMGKLLPASVARRRKVGFTLPFDDWLRGPMRSEVEGVLCDEAFGRGLGAALDPKAVRVVWADFEAGRTSWTRPYSLYTLKRWAERWL